MSGRDLLDRTVAAIAASAQWFLLAEDLPDRDGFLQAVTPTVKLVGIATLVALTVTQRALAVVSALALFATVLAVLSRVPVRTFLGRLTGPPAFALVVVAPQAVLMGGPSLGGLPLSAPGVDYVLTFAVRVTACVGFLSVLLLTTRFADLLAAFRRLRVPTIVVSLLGITYRYLLLFFAELERMVRARRSRTIAEPSLRRNWRDSGHFVGSFLVRSLERGERVQRAARARGGTGSTPTQPREPLGRADLAFGLVVALAVVVVVA
ncbi:cobalt ECF transporter T component CbiQ [Haloarcula argentinensis]|uniref:Cobalt ECF transporter T component CbiQ n=1 Tax=Haloarcula argentinensis TaxID=43776 RepID=A0A830FU16_HALAR|nr:cobalt ECF transporter T component CbiQ [Haloarcula argentinensis]GGM40482.1 cobalt ECF transporter T component CbiQ [Haloarcula argentinensis]